MKKLLLALFLVLPLAACASGPGNKVLDAAFTLATTGVANPITNTRFVTLESAYGIALSAADGYIRRYREGYRCTKTRLESISNPCSRRSVALRMQAGIRKASVAVGKARSFLINNPHLDPGEILSAAEAAVGELSALTTSN